MYGPTETTVIAMYSICQPERTITLGYAVPNYSVVILDKHMNVVPIGVTGELHIGGVGLAQYTNSVLTAAKFVRNPFGNGKLYKTGDLVRRLDCGEIEYMGRQDSEIKLRGLRIELGDIEAAIFSYHGIQGAVVDVRESAPGHTFLVAYLSPKDVNKDDLKMHLLTLLPSYMVPQVYVLLSSIPTTHTGKVDKSALPIPTQAQDDYDKDSSPLTDLEKTLVSLFAAVLDLEESNVSPTMNFFELGGDSIIALQLVSKAKLAGINLTVKQVFEQQTVQGLATVCSPTTQAKVAATNNGEIIGEAPLTPIQRWFFAHYNKKVQNFINQSFTLTPAKVVSRRLLDKAMWTLVKHHDVLRSRFFTSAGTPLFSRVLSYKQARREQPVLCRKFTIKSGDYAEIQRIGTSTQASLNIEFGPLIQGVLFEWTEHSKTVQKLLVVAHHLVIDGVSWRILLEDLQSAYHQLERGETPILSRKSTPFKEWAEKQCDQALQQDWIKTELPMWTQLHEHPDSCSIPTELDARDFRNTVSCEAQVHIELSNEKTDILLGEAHKSYHTQINDLLLTALGRALSRFIQGKTVALELEGHGREDLFTGVDLSRTVGWFTTQYPLLLDLTVFQNTTQHNGAWPIGDAIMNIKELLRKIPNKGIGYGMLRFLSQLNEEETQPDRAPSISFNFLGQFGEKHSQSSLFSISDISAGPTPNPQNVPRGHPIGFGGSVVNGKLHFTITYSSNIHRPDTAQNIGEWYKEALLDIVDHCTSRIQAAFTPSDFPLLRNITQTSLNELLLESLTDARCSPALTPQMKLTLATTVIEDIYPLSPVQKGMLFHAMLDEMGDYLCQAVFDVKGDIQKLRRSFGILMKAHPMLRTKFLWHHSHHEPVQVVVAPSFFGDGGIDCMALAIPWTEFDWTRLSAQERCA